MKIKNLIPLALRLYHRGLPFSVPFVFMPMLPERKQLLGFINGHDWEDRHMIVLPDGRPRPLHCCFGAIPVNAIKSLPACSCTAYHV